MQQEIGNDSLFTLCLLALESKSDVNTNVCWTASYKSSVYTNICFNVLWLCQNM